MNVTVFKPKSRTNFVCQWVDPITGKKKTRSTGTKIKRDAERFAGNLEKDLVNGTYHEDIRMTVIKLSSTVWKGLSIPSCYVV